MSALIIMCIRVCVFVCAPPLRSPNCCLLSHCQSDYEILFNLLGGGVFRDFDESDLLFLHSLYCLVVRCRAFVRSSCCYNRKVCMWKYLIHGSSGKIRRKTALRLSAQIHLFWQIIISILYRKAG